MADQNFMDLASKTASGIAGTDYMMLVNNSEAYKALVNDVAEAILSKLTSKSFSGLETTAKNVIGALNELNSKSKGYILGIALTSTNVLKFKGIFDSNTLGNGVRQSVFMFGNANSTSTLYGALCIYGDGTVQWRGYVQSGEVTVSMDSKGIISVNLPEIAYDTFCLVSAQRITAV